MNDTQRRCAAVFRQGLETKGWKVLDECTLVKNYCVFKMYDNTSSSKVGLVLPGYGWTLSREYIPLCAGRISSSVANIQLNEADKEDIENVLSIVKDLEAYASMPRYLQFANRMSRTKSSSVVTSLKPVKAEDGSSTRFIEILQSFESIFKVGGVYEIFSSSNEGICFYKYDVKTSKQTGRPFLYKDKRAFAAAAKQNKLQPVIIKEVPETKEVITYSNTDIIDYDVPSELLSELKSDYVKGAVLQLYNKNRNFTPLLNASYGSESIDDITTYFMTHDVDTDLTGRYLNSTVFDLLDRFKPVGFSTDMILNNISDEKNIQNAINYIVGLSESPYNIDRKFIKALYPLAGTFDPMQIPSCSSAETLYLTMKYSQSLPNLVKVFNALGVQVDDAIEVMPAQLTTDFINDLKKIFQIRYPFVDSQVDWDAALNGIIKYTQCVGFSIKDGFYINFHHYYLRRDYNSVFITDKNGVCWWRATCVNEKVFCNYNALLSFGIL